MVIVPTAYGDGLAGIHRGFVDLVALGHTDRTPRMVAAEPLGPFARSLRDDTDVPATVEPRSSVAFSIAGSVATYHGLNALKRTGGSPSFVGDAEQILAAQLCLAASEGLYVQAPALS